MGSSASALISIFVLNEQDKDSEHHAFECVFLKAKVRDELGLKRFALRTLVRVLAEQDSDSPTVGYYFEHRCTFADLLHHAGKLDSVQMEFFNDTAEEIGEFLSERGHDVPFDLLFEVVLKLFVNGHCAKNFDFLNSVQLGHVLYLAGSKSNHSCVVHDEYIQLFDGNRMYLKALRDFSVSDCLDLTTHYIPLQFSFNRRQELLKKRYFFTCECARCLEESCTPRPPFLDSIEQVLLQPVSEDNIEQLESLQERFARFSNKNFYKNMLLTRLFLEGPRENIEKSLALGEPALEGCKIVTDRMKILFILCSELSRSGATDPSDANHSKFKRYHEMAAALFTDVHGEEHQLVEEVRRMAQRDYTAEENLLTPSSPDEKKTAPPIFDAVGGGEVQSGPDS